MALLRDIQARHQLEAQGDRAGNAQVGFRLRLEVAVDAKADPQPVFLRLDMDVRGADLGGVLEQRLQQLDDRRILRAERRIESAEIDRAFAEVLLQLLGEPADFLGAPVHPVERMRHLALGHHHRLDVLLQDARQLVEGEQVRGIGHADQHLGAALLERYRAEAARRDLGQLQHHAGVEVVVLEVDERDVELPRQGACNLFFSDESHLDQNASETAPGALLLVERQLELLLRHDLLRDENVPQPQALGSPRGAHRSGGGTRSGHRDGQLSLFPVGLQVG